MSGIVLALGARPADAADTEKRCVCIENPTDTDINTAVTWGDDPAYQDTVVRIVANSHKIFCTSPDDQSPFTLAFDQDFGDGSHVVRQSLQLALANQSGPSPRCEPIPASSRYVFRLDGSRGSLTHR